MLINISLPLWYLIPTLIAFWITIRYSGPPVLWDIQLLVHNIGLSVMWPVLVLFAVLDILDDWKVTRWVVIIFDEISTFCWNLLTMDLSIRGIKELYKCTMKRKL